MARPIEFAFAREDLERMYVVEKLSTIRIAEQYGCTPSLVYLRLKGFGIPVRSRSEAHKLNPSRKGKTWTPEQRAKLERSRRSPEYRQKLSDAKKGDKAPHWKGGVSPASAVWASSWEWRARRKECYARDNWTCQDCRVKCGGRGKTKIQAHHIIPRRHGGGDDLGNLVTLCMSCHHKREHRYADALFA